MITTRQYRAYPTTEQKLTMKSWLRSCVYLYNRLLGDRLSYYENSRCSYQPVLGEHCKLLCEISNEELRDKPNYFSQKRYLPALKKDLIYTNRAKELIDLKAVPSQTLQQVCKRLDVAYSRYVAGDSKGNRSGKPRFKSISRYRTMVFEGVKLEKESKRWLWFKLPKNSHLLKVRKHRNMPAGYRIKACVITKKADGWYFSIELEDKSVPTFEPDNIVPTWDNSIGMDAVLHEDDYLALSDNSKLPSLKSFRKNQAELVKISQKKSKARKRSKARRKLAKKEALWHQRIARSRRQHAYETANQVVNKGFKHIFHEKLNLAGLSKKNKAKKVDGQFVPNGQSAKSGLNKSWADAAFAQFFTILKYKAEKAGVQVKAVKPAYTSQLLSYQDEIVFTDCSVREYRDESNNLLIDRDINSAINIKRVGLDIFPTIKRRRGKIVMEDSKTESTSKQILNLLSRKEASLIALA